MSSADSKPRLTFRVGVTGKHDLTPAQATDLRPRVAASLSLIRTTLQDELPGSKGAYSEEAPILRATSSLAEGAARLLAEEALKLRFDLQAPLPFQREEYKKDFETAESRLAFDQLLPQATAVFEMEGETSLTGEHLAAAYQAVGSLVVDHSDLIIAIWDGLPGGDKDGTANLLETARRRGIPVVCFGIGGFPDTPLNTETVIQAVRPPWLASKKPEAPDANGSYVETASGKTPFLGRLWSQFFNLMRSGADLPKAWPENIPPSAFESHYARTDVIARRLAGLYRGAFLLNYTLGLCAVFFALLGNADEERASFWLWSELAAIVIVAITILSIRRNRWHFRSVDCRYLAEQFRILCYIHELGLTAPVLRIPAHQLHSDVHKSWMEWRLRAMLRERPLPSVYLTAKEAGRYYKDVIDDLVRGQIVYHGRNQESLETIEKRLDRLGWFFVSVAAAACVLHFRVDHTSHAALWLTLCAAGFPAAAAACHAIGSQGEFRRLSERSEAMHGSLKSTHQRMEDLSDSGKLSPAALRRECEALAALMIEEVVDWQILYRKPVPPG